MKRLILTLAAVAAMSAVSSACPPVAVGQLRLQSYSYAAPVQLEQVYTQAYVAPVALALEVNSGYCSNQLSLAVHARRQPARNIFRRAPRARRANVNVQVGNICH